jgi:hypothetical protein
MSYTELIVELEHVTEERDQLVEQTKQDAALLQRKVDEARKKCMYSIKSLGLKFFEKNSTNPIIPRKWLNRKTNQKVHLKTFPMNGHVSRFRQSYIIEAFSVSRPLVTEVTISP